MVVGAVGVPRLIQPDWIKKGMFPSLPPSLPPSLLPLVCVSDVQALCKEADVVVGAVGVPRLIQPEWIKKNKRFSFPSFFNPSLDFLGH